MTESPLTPAEKRRIKRAALGGLPESKLHPFRERPHVDGVQQRFIDSFMAEQLETRGLKATSRPLPSGRRPYGETLLHNLPTQD